MENIQINILRSPSRSTVRRFLGILYIILAILWIAIRIVHREAEPGRFPFPYFDIVYALFFGFSGAVFLIEGSGISIGRWFGEAYIRLDSTGIFIKKGVFSKEWSVLWSEISEVEFSMFKIRFGMKDNSSRELNYDNLDYEHIQILKQSVRKYATEINIEVIPKHT
jgi:hypothetical protein